ncbi:ShlB/FhaC/HecB family hemolysin secretion/activation protein [Candidatus Omnitrophota bacterium]
MRKLLIVAGVILALFAFNVLALAQQAPASQTAGAVSSREKISQKFKTLEERVKEKREVAKEAPTEEIVLPDEGPKVLITKIVVEYAVLLSEKEIREIIAPFENTELSVQGMQKIADLISAAYRKKGYVTSRAYLPPQTISDGVLIIRVVEGTLGQLGIKGNKHFSTPLLKKRIGIEPEGYFDYSALQRSLVYINEHPDRTVKAVLTPGQEPGTTDIVVEVDDRRPMHAGFYYDNYGSRYIGRDRYSLVFEHNNLFGQDDKLYIKGQMAEDSHLYLQQGRYTYPLSRRLELGGHLLFSKLKLGQEFAGLDSGGKSKIFGLFSNYRLVERDNWDMRLNFGLDVKDITNELSGAELSHDELSIAKVGFDLDAEDDWGRTVLTAALETGIADFLGSMEAKDPNASRAGAGGKFTKGVFNVFRLQPMPFSTWILLKNSFQLSNYNLVAAEQFQIGGATSVRGYPPGEYSGDQGFYSALEWSVPFYGLSRDFRVPFRKEKLYDTFRFVFFFDIGGVTLNNPQVGEDEHRTIRAAGFGGRLTIPEELEIRVEVGYPLSGPTPSDSDHAHVWIEFRYKI